MPKTTIQELGEFGQSIWLDYISRPLMKSGKLQGMIDFGLRGMTSNPSIFNEVISTLSDYDEKIMQLAKAGKPPFEIYDEITIQDIQDACDIFRPIYEKTNRLDGYVSLEINPKLAMKVEESITEGLRLFKKVNRPNVMIKVPATMAGFRIIEELLSEGVNVNVTLIFSLAQYQQAVKAFFQGMNRLSLKEGVNLSKIRSVASVFVSRIDTAVDSLIDERLTKETNLAKKNQLLSLKGKAVVANSGLIFQKFDEMFYGNLFNSLSGKNCQAQRVLWGSTGTKNSLYSDIKYITELIAKPTVNTLPEKTIKAFLDHGTVREALTKDAGDARGIVGQLKSFGIDIDKVCAKLLGEGVTAFEKSFESLLNSIEAKARSLCARS